VRKVVALLLIILFAIASVAGYLVLTKKIIAGEKQIAEGQKQLEEGQIKLDEGKARLEAGKQELSQGKKEYAQSKRNPFLVVADKLLKGGKGFKEARGQIAEGDTQVAKGQSNVDAGERRLDAGELRLRQGMERLRLARGARVACALGAVVFISLSIVLGFRWRRALARIVTHTDV